MIQSTINTESHDIVSNKEKRIAALSHFIILIGSFAFPLGHLVLIILWRVYRNKSNYIRYHAVQEIAFQLGYFILLSGFFVLWGLINVFVGKKNDSALISIDPMTVLALAFPVSYLVCLGYTIWAGIKAYKGELYRYPIAGKWSYEKVYRRTFSKHNDSKKD